MVEREDSRSVNFWLQLWFYGISGSRALYLHCQCRKAFGASTEETIALDEERRLQDLRSERDFMQARPHEVLRTQSVSPGWILRSKRSKTISREKSSARN